MLLFQVRRTVIVIINICLEIWNIKFLYYLIDFLNILFKLLTQEGLQCSCIYFFF